MNQRRLRSVQLGVDRKLIELDLYIFKGKPQVKTCTKILFWSQSERLCVWPAQSDCE